jgi:hypothetical protein
MQFSNPPHDGQTQRRNPDAAGKDAAPAQPTHTRLLSAPVKKIALITPRTLRHHHSSPAAIVTAVSRKIHPSHPPDSHAGSFGDPRR